MPSKTCNRTGQELMINWDHSVHQSGGILSRHSTQQLNARDTRGVMTRAVVTAVYYVDEKAPISNIPGASEETRRNLLCDVRTYGRVSRVLHCVPMLQRVQGVWDEDTYIPRAARGTTDGSDLTTAVPYTDPAVMDGDHVLVGFLENDPAQPVVLPFTLGHPATQNPVRRTPAEVPDFGPGQPERNRRIRHGGTLIEITEEGNFRIDATGAAKKEFNRGSEVANNGTTGVIVIKTKDAGGAIVRLQLNKDGNVILEDGGATEFLAFTKASHNARLKAAAEIDLEAPVVKVGTSLQLAEVCGNTDAMVKGTSYMIAHNLVIAALVAWLQALKAPLFDLIVPVVTETLLTAISGFQTSAAVPGGLLSTKAKVG